MAKKKLLLDRGLSDEEAQEAARAAFESAGIVEGSVTNFKYDAETGYGRVTYDADSDE